MRSIDQKDRMKKSGGKSLGDNDETTRQEGQERDELLGSA